VDQSQGIVQKVVDWLASGDASGWAAFVLLLGTNAFTWLRRTRPSRLVFRETLNVRPVFVAAAVRQKISIRFNGEPVESLAQLDAELYNAGTATIKKPAITVHFPENTRVLDVSITEGTEGMNVIPGNGWAVIELPFLNSYRHHTHVVRITFLLTGQAEPISVAGAGEGWSIWHQRLRSREEREREMRWFTVAMVAALGCSMAWSTLLRAAVGVEEFSLVDRAMLYTPLAIATVFFALCFRDELRRLIRR
jgi:hypothetical protein